MNDINLVKIDWISILSFGLLILLGLGNIFSRVFNKKFALLELMPIIFAADFIDPF